MMSAMCAALHDVISEKYPLFQKIARYSNNHIAAGRERKRDNNCNVTTLHLAHNNHLHFFLSFSALSAHIVVPSTPRTPNSINMYVVDHRGMKKRHVVGLAPVSGMCNSLNR